MRIISGIFKNRPLASPKGLSTRPTSEKLREALFNISQNYIQESVFLDLFAGSGAMGIEAISRGASKATFIDADRDSIRCIKENLKNFKIEDQALVLPGDVFTEMYKLMQKGLQVRYHLC